MLVYYFIFASKTKARKYKCHQLWKILNSKFLVSNLRLYPFRTKHIHLGFVVWEEDGWEEVAATVENSWGICCRPAEITMQAGSSCTIIVKIAP